MRQILEPLSVGSINGRVVRFFCSPSTRPDLPWCAVDVESDYAAAAADALSVLSGDLPPQTALSFAFDAFHGRPGGLA